MSVVIRSTGISAGESPIAGAVTAAEDCLRSGPRVELVVGTGTYREDNAFEPSNVSQIQQRLGIHPEYVPRSAQRAVMSFDLCNGDDGLLTAVHVISSLFTTENLANALLITSDGHKDATFPFARAAAALLLEPSDPHGADDRGFGPVHFVRRRHPALRGHLDVTESEGRSKISVEQDEDRAARSLDMALDVARAASAHEGLKLIGPQTDADQPYRLARELGIPPQDVLIADVAGGDPRTSTIAVAFHQALADRRVSSGDRVLMVSADGGPCAASAVYRV